MKAFRQTLILLLAACLLPIGGRAESVRCMDMRSAALYIHERANALDEEIEFYYPPELDGQFTAETMNAITENTAVGPFYYGIYESDRKVRLEDITYRPGFRAARLWLSGRTDLLTDTERTILQRAQAVVEQGRQAGYGGSSAAMEKYLHDELCRMTTYQINPELGTGSELTIYDTAEGPLLYGVGECDAYADAFYLLATLAGFEADTQSGIGDGESHVWNIICMDGRWYGVDVTWDDAEGSDGKVTYRYLNMGLDAMENYSWHREFSPHALQSFTDWSLTVYNSADHGAYLPGMDALAGYVADKLNGGQTEFHVMTDGLHTADDFYGALRESSRLQSAWSASAFVNDLQGYTLYDLYFSN